MCQWMKMCQMIGTRTLTMKNPAGQCLLSTKNGGFFACCSWYKDTDNEKSCWPVPAIYKKWWFLFMLLLPTVLVIFVLSKNCTPYELHREIKWCIAEGLHGFTEENFKDLLERCLATGQSTSSTNCSSVLALKFNAVMTSDDTFAEWCVHASLLLLVLVHSATRRLQSQFRVQHSFKPHKHRPIRTRNGKISEAHG
jgi:hypothetical protein